MTKTRIVTGIILAGLAVLGFFVYYKISNHELDKNGVIRITDAPYVTVLDSWFYATNYAQKIKFSWDQQPTVKTGSTVGKGPSMFIFGTLDLASLGTREDQAGTPQRRIELEIIKDQKSWLYSTPVLVNGSFSGQIFLRGGKGEYKVIATLENVLNGREEQDGLIGYFTVINPYDEMVPRAIYFNNFDSYGVTVTEPKLDTIEEHGLVVDRRTLLSGNVKNLSVKTIQTKITHLDKGGFTEDYSLRLSKEGDFQEFLSFPFGPGYYLVTVSVPIYHSPDDSTLQPLVEFEVYNVN